MNKIVGAPSVTGLAEVDGVELCGLVPLPELELDPPVVEEPPPELVLPPDPLPEPPDGGGGVVQFGGVPVWPVGHVAAATVIAAPVVVAPSELPAVAVSPLNDSELLPLLAVTLNVSVATNESLLTVLPRIALDILTGLPPVGQLGNAVSGEPEQLTLCRLSCEAL